MARVIESKGNDLVSRLTRTYIMGDGIINIVLKGSSKGRRLRRFIIEEEGRVVAVWLFVRLNVFVLVFIMVFRVVRES